MAEQPFKVTVTKIEATHPALERAVQVQQVRVGTSSAEWVEEYASQAEVDAFIRGLRAAGSFLGAPLISVEEAS
jgi:hypothetical protein